MNRTLIILFLTLLHSCNSSIKTKLDNNKIVFLLVENSFHPTDEEILLAEDLIEQRLKIYNAEEEASNLDRRYFFGDSLHYESDLIFFDKYYRQCEASINKKGEKI